MQRRKRRRATGRLTALDRFGLERRRRSLERGTYLTDAEKITAGRSMVERTQFKVDPQDLPGWASSPWGKVVDPVQERSRTTSRPSWGARSSSRRSSRRPAPMTRFLIAGLVAGAAIDRGEERDPGPRARIRTR
jgi:hypothetical protein